MALFLSTSHFKMIEIVDKEDCFKLLISTLFFDSSQNGIYRHHNDLHSNFFPKSKSAIKWHHLLMEKLTGASI